MLKYVDNKFWSLKLANIVDGFFYLHNVSNHEIMVLVFFSLNVQEAACRCINM